MTEGKSSGKGYAVGYGKPPASGQFKPGKSGNPSGKKKGKGLAQYIAEVGEADKTFLQGGKPVTMPANEALAEKLFNDALKGKPQAAKLVFEAQKGTHADALNAEGVLSGPEEVEVARTHADWLKLIEEVEAASGEEPDAAG